jgi:hypothetical protein
MLAIAGAASADGPPATGHVRGLEVAARQFLAAGIDRSTTLARMVREIERTDVIVLVTTAPPPARLGGQTMMIASRGACRFVVVRPSDANPPDDMVGFLGHELRHGLEVASDPTVRDREGMVRLYARIGHGAKGGPYETPAALETGLMILREIGAR